MSQQMDALAEANRRRFARAAMRARITAAGGEGHARRTPQCRANAMRAAAEELAPRPVCIDNMPLHAFLAWAVRPGQAKGIMAAADVRGELRTIGELTDRQVAVVCDELREAPARIFGRAA